LAISHGRCSVGQVARPDGTGVAVGDRQSLTKGLNALGERSQFNAMKLSTFSVESHFIQSPDPRTAEILTSPFRILSPLSCLSVQISHRFQATQNLIQFVVSR
jgi:hypothetical protein